MAVGTRRWLPLLFVLLTGCAGRLTPPAAPLEPVEVFLLDHGRHASLVLPRPEGGAVRYSYGEWSWYVEARRHPLAAVAALFWPTPSGLGRREHPTAVGCDDLARLAPEGLVQAYPLQVEAARADALARRLDTHFEQPRAAPVYSQEFGLTFVPYPRGYWLTHQSNLVTARWLRQLGVEIQGIPWLSRWRLEASAEPCRAVSPRPTAL